MARLVAVVYVADGKYGPGDDVPPEVAKLITNPAAWEGSKVPGGAKPAEPTTAPPVLTPIPIPVTEPDEGEGDAADSVPPPKSGPGSGAPAWAQYASDQGVTVPADAKRDDIVAALAAAGVPTDRQD